MINRKVSIVFRGGATMEIRAVEREAVEIARIWNEHIKNPAQQRVISTSYADGKGDLRLIASEIAGISFEQI